MKYRTKIISAFPGTGKTTYHQKHQETTLDSDSSNFSWGIDNEGNKIRNPQFPKNDDSFSLWEYGSCWVLSPVTDKKTYNKSRRNRETKV